MATKKAKAATQKMKLTSGIEVPALLALALLLGLLCILPWLSQQDGTQSFQALQVSIALLLALGGGVCLGYQFARDKKK